MVSPIPPRRGVNIRNLSYLATPGITSVPDYEGCPGSSGIPPRGASLKRVLLSPGPVRSRIVMALTF